MPRKRKAAPLTVSLHDLADLEVRLLDRVCRDGPYTSPVMLAADEWRGSDDPLVASVEMVMWTLYGLNEQGLVVLRERSQDSGHPTWGIPITYIRATPEAFDLLDFRPPIRVFGEWAQGPGRETPLRRADMTEFRNHAEQAFRSPIERSSLSDHLDRYPDHVTSRVGW